MASPLSLLIALRFSRGRRRGGMVSLISVISTIGIALGVAVLIVGLSATNASSTTAFWRWSRTVRLNR